MIRATRNGLGGNLGFLGQLLAETRIAAFGGFVLLWLGGKVIQKNTETL